MAGDLFSTDALLSAQQVAARLGIVRSDGVRWLRRLCRQHGLPLIEIRGAPRLTEANFRALLDKLTCSPCGGGGGQAIGTSAGKSRSVKKSRSSQNIVRERVTRMTRPT